MEFLDNVRLRGVIAAYVTDVCDVDDDGVFALQWRSTETFYRHTEAYVAPAKKAAYKAALEQAFPGKKGVL